MSLLAGLDRFEIGELEALAERRNDGPRQAGAVFMKPARSRLNGVLAVCETLCNALI